MAEVNIKAAMKQAIARSGRQNKELAKTIGLSPQGLSNYLNDPNRDVPVDLVGRLARELGDLQFKYEVGDWWLDLGLAITGTTVIPIPIALKEDMDDEQDDREQLDRQAKRILRKLPEAWSKEDFDFIVKYRKEFNEEISSEHLMLDALDDWIKRAEIALQEVN
ncbi:helix-turn-helix domain-containing protein [Lacticaseibacillus manihotivorans]|nr:helix-turn-helix transcriptional regulator [Lacticaseibacillus manihotivorans]QFQ90981.1 helix-turn-helix domain-containing protein [Lacticaseibacillus manihotivorans]